MDTAEEMVKEEVMDLAEEKVIAEETCKLNFSNEFLKATENNLSSFFYLINEKSGTGKILALTS
jgi:hypothetical protein